LPKSLRVAGGTELGAVVEMVTVVVPLPVTVGGRKLQELSDGNPAHENVVAPLKPFEPVTVSMVLAVSPGLLTLTAAGANARVKSGCKVTFTVIAGEVEAAKSGSPEYFTVMLSVPVGSEVVTKDAVALIVLLALTNEFPSCVLPEKNVTDPPGIEGAWEVVTRFAVRVILAPGAMVG